MSAANPNSMEKSMVSVLVVANAGGGGCRCHVVSPFFTMNGLYVPWTFEMTLAIYLFIYLFLINACNLKVMARFTELNT
jgi:hypothetical protein